MTTIEAKVKTLPESYQEFWYERSGIYMDSGATQPEADKLAWADLQRWIKNGGKDES
jgi:hypothetical protein